MWRSIVLTLLLGALGLAYNLHYLDPTKLQTLLEPQIQRRAALDIITQYARRVNVVIDPLFFTNKKDTFQLKANKGVLNIKASTGVAAVWGFNYYLKKYCKSQIEWQTKNVHVPYPLPEVDELVVANDRFRYYQNVRTASYSFVWWDIFDWRQHVQWMALNGINLALAPVAQEAAWAQVYHQIGMTQGEIDDYFTGPAFLSWQRMGNLYGFGGPLPKSWHNLQSILQKEVINRMRNLGMIHVLPVFNGHVPLAFARLFPKTTLHKVDQWNTSDIKNCSGLFLNPFDPLFSAIGKMFLDELTIHAPVSHIYSADPFTEGNITLFSTAFVQETAKKIYNTLAVFDKDAVWLIQNWMFVDDPKSWPVKRAKRFLNAVPKGRVLILDMQSEQWPQYNIYKMYFGHPFIWCMLHNFGGTLGMHGNMVAITKDVYEVRSRANSTMIGIGLTPEGINQNYVVYDLMLESAWRKLPVHNLDEWAADYAERRYGCNATAEAWKHLLRSVYSFKGSNKIRGSYVVTQKPSLNIKPWAWYKSYDLFEALKKLLFVDNALCTTEGYQYDVVDVTRQALQYRAEQLYVNVVNDRSDNTFVFNASIKRFLDTLKDLSELLYENEHFLAANLFKKARILAHNHDEADLYEFNARNQITLWGSKEEFSDYACKQWAELYRYYYYPRWAVFLAAAMKAKQTGEEFNEKATQRVVTANVELAFVTNRSLDTPLTWPQWAVTLHFAKSLYRKWEYAPDVEDLPVIETVNVDPRIKETTTPPSTTTVSTTISVDYI